MVLQFIRRVWARAYAWVSGNRPADLLQSMASQVAPTDGALALVPEVPAEDHPQLSANPDGPVWHFRSVILDRLDEYMDCVRKVQRFDPDAYSLITRIGLSVPAECYLNPEAESNKAQYSHGTRSGFGGVLFGGPEMVGTKGSIWPSFVYFNKMNSPSRVERFAGDVFAVTCVYDSRSRAKRLVAPLRFHIGVDVTGRGLLLREFIGVSSVVIPKRTKRGRYRRGQAFTLRSSQWSYPNIPDSEDRHGKSANDWAVDLFWMAYMTSQECQSSIIIRVKSHGVIAAFGIDEGRAKYFFKDRDTSALARDGKRKRIFHSVVAHDRAIDVLRTVQVRRHYRGLRHFAWNGYDVGIVFPDNNAIMKFPIASTELDDIAVTERLQYMNQPEVGARIDSVLSH